jgi:hypothetical protein
VAAGCTGKPVQPAATPTTAGPTVSPAATTSATRPTIVLEASFSQRASRWGKAVFIPFGSARADLRYIPAHEFPTFEPTAFAIAPDRSIWILDVANHRLAHFDPVGKFIEDRPGYHFVSTDLAFVRDVLYVVRQNQIGLVDKYAGRDGTHSSFTIKDKGRRPYITQLVPLTDELLGQVDSPPPLEGPSGLMRIDQSSSGQVAPIPGYPIGPRGWATVDQVDSGEITLTWTDDRGSIVQPFHIDFVRTVHGKSDHMDGVMSVGNFVVADQDLYMYVKIAARTLSDDQIGARFLLRVGSSPLLWERLPQPSGVDDDTQRRRIALGPDGHLYLMVTDKDGVRIYRRPST